MDVTCAKEVVEAVSHRLNAADIIFLIILPCTFACLFVAMWIDERNLKRMTQENIRKIQNRR